LFQFQREDIVKLLTKRFGILAWDPGCGKTIGGLTFALGALAIGDCAPRVLVVAPQDLIPQWFAEIGKFFGAEFASEWFVVSGIEDAIQLARLSRRVPKTYPLFAITWYEALRDAIGDEKLVKRDDGAPCFYCNRMSSITTVYVPTAAHSTVHLTFPVAGTQHGFSRSSSKTECSLWTKALTSKAAKACEVSQHDGLSQPSIASS